MNHVKHAILGVLLWFLCNGMAGANAESWRTSFPDNLEVDRLITQALADRFDVSLTGNHAPFARRLNQLRHGEIDLLCGLLKTADREEYAYYLSPPYKVKSNKYFFVRKGEAHRLRKFEDLTGLVVGVQIGSKYFPRFDEEAKIRKVATSSDKGRFRMLASGRIDVVIHTDVYGLSTLHRLGLQDVVEIAPFKYTEYNPVYMAISRKSELIKRKDAVEKVFRLMVESGEIDQVIRDYFVAKGLPVPEYK